MIENNKTQNELRDYFKKWPKFYYTVGAIFGPMYNGGLTAKKFLKKYPSSGIILNIGSGPRILAKGITNVDITQYKGVDVIGDIKNLPFNENHADIIVCNSVLEHIDDWPDAIDQIRKVLKVDGQAYFSIPFLYPFHASPEDYTRWTTAGLKKIFSEGFEVIEVGSISGPFSTLTVYLLYLFATLLSFGSERLYWFLVNIFIFIFFPIKYLDVIGNRLPFAENMASVLYIVVKKI